MIIVVDHGVGNLSSVCKMLRKVVSDVRVSSEPQEILTAYKLVLPGVRHFDHGMKILNRSGLRKTLDLFALELDRPVLGICLGAQILGKGSEEAGEPGLGWVDMRCVRFPEMPGLRVPHMGWVQVALKRKSPLLGLP
jgi:glutamine amidotransferase